MCRPEKRGFYSRGLAWWRAENVKERTLRIRRTPEGRDTRRREVRKKSAADSQRWESMPVLGLARRLSSEWLLVGLFRGAEADPYHHSAYQAKYRQREYHSRSSPFASFNAFASTTMPSAKRRIPDYAKNTVTKCWGDKQRMQDIHGGYAKAPSPCQPTITSSGTKSKTKAPISLTESPNKSPARAVHIDVGTIEE
jgi:hypothetical protein